MSENRPYENTSQYSHVSPFEAGQASIWGFQIGRDHLRLTITNNIFIIGPSKLSRLASLHSQQSQHSLIRVSSTSGTRVMLPMPLLHPAASTFSRPCPLHFPLPRQRQHHCWTTKCGASQSSQHRLGAQDGTGPEIIARPVASLGRRQLLYVAAGGAALWIPGVPCRAAASGTLTRPQPIGASTRTH